MLQKSTPVEFITTPIFIWKYYIASVFGLTSFARLYKLVLVFFEKIERLFQETTT